MKYKIELTIKGHLIIEANSEVEARELVEDGYSMSQVNFDDEEIDDIYQLQEVAQQITQS